VLKDPVSCSLFKPGLTLQVNALLICLLGCCIFVVGCSNPQTRAEKSQNFQSLTQSVQQKALQGDIERGMNTQAVYVALGEPARVEKLDQSNREKWVYSETRMRQVPHWDSIARQTPQGVNVSTPIYRPVEISEARDSFAVEFENGRVVGWKSLS